LGRVLIGLKNLNYPVAGPFTDVAAGTTLQDAQRVSVSGTIPMEPLGVNSQSSTRWDATTFTIQQSRYDLAAVDASALATPLTPDPFGYFRQRTDSAYSVAGTYLATWYAPLIYRFQVHPYPLKPFDPTVAGINGGSAKMAQTVPIFLPNCTDFKVEFAGDFVTQSATGTPSAATPDGTIDFDYNATTGVSSIHWFGLGATVNAFYASAWSFEKTNTATNYVCAWGGESALSSLAPGVSPRPKLLRITCTIRDPNGRLADGQSFEYIVNLNDTY
jgi:hypothetical protein